jgi:DNA-binding response OmpR family regulator
MNRSILIVEDDTTTRNLLAANFGAMGYRVSCAGDVAEASALASEIWPDVVLLDRIVKGQPALAYARQLRSERRTADAAIIIIGSRVPRDPDAVAALESGADDYLIMPTPMEVLLAHVKAVMRRRPLHSKPTPSRSLDCPSIPPLDAPAREAATSSFARWYNVSALVHHAQQPVDRSGTCSGVRTVREAEIEGRGHVG